MPLSPAPSPALLVLASGSGGNCSILHLRTHAEHAATPLTLIDLGLSPRAVRTHLDTLGFSIAHVGAVLLTHLDSDHCHPGWCSDTRAALPDHATLFIHKQHAHAARQMNLNAGRFTVYRDHFRTDHGLSISPLVQSHDSLGTVSFRITPRDPAADASLGFATDLGRVTHDLLAFLRGVRVLALESNYCPALQLASARPDFLKRRIMGGSGHLSNHQCLDAIARLRQHRAPDHVVLLHLSRECNDPALVASLHADAPYTLTITSQFEPTAWIPLGATHAQRADLPVQFSARLTTPGVTTRATT